VRDPRLSGFAADGEWDTARPSAALAVALEIASGVGWRCPGATGDEMLGLLRQWQALEAWAAAGKLGLLRALIRDDDQPLPGGGFHGDLPDGWTRSLTHEVALALSMPAVSADKLMWLASNLQAVLPVLVTCSPRESSRWRRRGRSTRPWATSPRARRGRRGDSPRPAG
jgi:hypothetical protein